ncbi:CopG family transcriptional regulator, partial [Enterocloster aldenensis]
MEDRLAVISLIISNPDSVATVNEKFHLQSSLIIARLGVPCREYGVS